MQGVYQQQQFRTRQDVKHWATAVEQAESILYPNRQALYLVYKVIDVDDQIETVTRARINNVLSKKFKLVDKNGKEVPEKTKLLQKLWFRDFIEYALASKWWGHSLVNFGNVVGTASAGDIRFDGIKLVPREYVLQERSMVVNIPGFPSGKDYRDQPWADWCLPIGKERDLGTFMKVAPLVIFKRNALIYWTEYCELFGMPMRKGHTDIRDEEMRSNMENMLANMGAKAWGVFDINDNIEFVEAAKNSNNSIYDLLIDRIDRAIAKVFLGQTGTTDEKAYSGSSKVHKEVGDNVTKADLEWLEFIVNDSLLPLLNLHGWGLKGYYLKYDESLSISDQFEIDGKLLDYYEIPENYITEKYGTPVVKKELPADTIGQPNAGNLKEVQKKLKNYYS